MTVIAISIILTDITNITDTITTTRALRTRVQMMRLLLGRPGNPQVH
jgi:hypothetical protein